MFGARFGRRGGGGATAPAQPVLALDGTVTGIGAAGPVMVENLTTGVRAILTAGDGDNLFALARAAGIAATGDSLRLADTTALSGAVAVPSAILPSVRAIIGQSEDSIGVFANGSFYTGGPYPTLQPGVDAAVAIRRTDDRSGAATLRALTPAAVAARDVSPGFVAFANLWHVGSGGVPLRLVGATMPGTSMTMMMDNATGDGRDFADDAAVVALAEAAWGPVTDVSYVWWNSEATPAKTLWTDRAAHFFGINPDGSPYDFAAGPLDQCLIDTTGRGKGLLGPAAKVHLALPGLRVEGADATVAPPRRSYLLNADGSSVNGMMFQNAQPAVQARRDFLAQAPVAQRGEATLAPTLCRFGDYTAGVKDPAGETAIHPALRDADGQILFAQHLAAGELIAAGHLGRAWVDRWERSADATDVTMIVRLPPGATLTTIRKQRGLAVPAVPRPHQQPDGMGFAILRDADRLTTGTGFEDTNLRRARPLYRADNTDAALYPTAFRGTVAITDSGTDLGGGVREARVRVTMVEPLTATERVYWCADGGMGSWNLHGIADYDARLYLDGLIAHIPALAVGSHPYPGIPVEPQAMAVVGDMTVAGAPADTTAPTILSRSPADDATGVALATSALTLTFSEPVTWGTGAITLRQNVGGTWSDVESFDVAAERGTAAGQVEFTGASVTLRPSAALTASREHAVRVDATAIRDAAGNTFAGIADDAGWSFTTAAPAPTTFAFADDYLRDPLNTPAGTTRIEHVARFRAVTAYGPATQTRYIATQGNLGCDLGWQVNSTSTTVTFHVRLKDAANTTIYSAVVPGAVLPAAGTWVTASLDWNVGAGTASVTLNGVTTNLTLTGTIANPTMQSNRKIAFGGTDSGASKVPADMEVDYVETWFTTGGARTLRKRFDAPAFAAEKATPTGWFVDATP